MEQSNHSSVRHPETRRKEANLILQQYSALVDKMETFKAGLLKDNKGKVVREFSFQLGAKTFSVTNVKGAIHFGEVTDTVSPCSFKDIVKIVREAISVYSSIESEMQEKEATISNYLHVMNENGADVKAKDDIIQRLREEISDWKSKFTSERLPIKMLEVQVQEQNFSIGEKDKEIGILKNQVKALKNKINMFEALGSPKVNKKNKTCFMSAALSVVVALGIFLTIWKFIG